MGIIDYLIRNCLFKSIVYTSIFLVSIGLIFLDYSNLKNIQIDSLSQYVNSNSISQNLNLVLESLINGFKNSYVLTIFFLGLIYINFYAFFKAIIFRKEINLPFSLSFYQSVKNYWWQKNSVKISHDKFNKLKNNKIFYTNSVSIDIEKYQNLKEEIIQYLKLPVDYELDVTRYGQKGVLLEFYKLPKIINFDIKELEKGKLFYGYSKNGKYSLPLSEQTSVVVAGESGSSKSTFLNVLMASTLYNLDLIEHLYLIDLKGVELARYSKLNKISFVKDIDNVLKIIKELNQIMKKRYDYMIEKELIKFDGPYIYCVIDEIGTINTQNDKKIKDEIFANLTELLQKGRASKIIFLIFSQKIDSVNIPTNVLTNIQSSVLMRTDSDFNINNTCGTKEQVAKITKVDADSFPFGRAIVKNGITSEKMLIQVPLIDYYEYKKIVEI
ncbi:FtsK/SpoIIIE family protein [Aliarcobacter faecis]|uniref:FtsK/SpoIIIE domain-containing protein n=1 Tax=Aliarcobacter faecis TaxID=1564138 RepID=UPI00047E7566|nr:FtsK/SpoIIIE domain-containing protein [Aliarcobacter faecis]QKF73917.1 FtsK/SpoIIIE family protein [Aliarcobacter faecis]